MERIAHLETNWPIGYYLLYYNHTLRHYNIDSAAVNMILIDFSLFHNIDSAAVNMILIDLSLFHNIFC